MKQTIKKTIALFLSVLMLTAVLFSMPVTAGAVGSPKDMESSALPFWADPENRLTAADITAFNSGDKTAMVGAVGVYARASGEDKYYLFLPSNADCNNLKVWFNGDCAVSGTALESGVATNVFRSCNSGGVMHSYTLTVGGKSYSLYVMKSGDVGTVYIDTASGSIATVTNSSEHTTSESGTVMVVNADGTLEYDGALEKISGRGNATWSTGNVKNPYNIKLAASTKLLGMPKAKKWCLLANSGDGSLIKNQLTYDFADYIGIRYQTHCKPVDLYINQQYYGSYSLAEKAEIKSNRVNVTDNYENLEIANGTVDEATGTVTPADMDSLGLATRTIDADNSTVSAQTEASSNYYGHTVGSRRYSAYRSVSQSGISYSNINDPSDLTGGYLFELEISQRWAAENAGFCAYNRQGWTVKSNDYISRHQIDYCYPLLYALGSALYNGGTVPSTETTTNCSSLGNTSGLLNNYGAKSITNPAPAQQYQGKRWSDLLDADSAVRYYWTQEFFKNMDSSTSSTYFYKDVDSKDSKLYAGPLWDMDNAFAYNGRDGSRWGYSWTSTDGWYTKNTRIYRWRTRDSNTSYSTDSYAPLSFYGALATNCTDFWQLAKGEWFNSVSQAVDVLTSPESEENTVLHSVDYYVDTVAKSAMMNFSRVSESGSYDTDTIKSQMKTWLGARQTWIDSQFEKTGIAQCDIATIPDQSFTGFPAEPQVTVTCNGAALTEGRDYTVSYSSNTDVGTGFATVTGKGMYTGTKSTSFRIKCGTLSGTVAIPEAAYSGDVLEAVVKDDDGRELTSYITYQWYRDGVAISGATGSTYTVTDTDKNKTLTLSVTGDGTRLAGTLQSGDCVVRTGVKPDSYSETVATWFYDYQLNADDLSNVAADGCSVLANDGRQAGTATLTACVDAVNPAKLSWSDPLSDIYYNNTTSNTYDASPVMSASSSRPWGEYPYYEVTVDTRDYENLTFSAKLGGTKKGPAVWQLQYSTDGVNYTDIDGAAFVISDNKKMQDAFTDVALPDSCSNQREVHIRAAVIANRTIKNNLAIVGSGSGDSSVNNVMVKGNRISAIASLDAPDIISRSNNGDGTALFDSDKISLRDKNGGAAMYYNLGGEDILYTDAFCPFDENAKIGDTVTVTAYARFDDITSDTVTATYTFAGCDINHFVYDTYTENVTAGTLFSNGGAFDGSARMTAYTDGESQYVPKWNDKNGAFVLAPDDGALWTANAGFTFALSTSGYEDIRLTAKAYTTAQGPNSLRLQYSYDGGTWYTASANMQLTANGALEQYLMTYELPDGCANRAQVYVRLVASENATHGSATVPSTALHNNASKGNLYINDIYFSGERSGDLRMPYTNKTSDYFGDTGSLKYYSADGKTMYYSVADSNRKILLSGTYDAETGITVQNAADFNRYARVGYSVSVWAGDGDDRSAVNTRTYYYKGDTVCEFSYNMSDDPHKARPVAAYLSPDGTTLTNTDGAHSGTLSMTPNGVTNTTLTADDTYGVKASWASDNLFTYDKSTPLDTPAGNGCWLIATSTEGYRGITLNLEQLSSNKAPRDWGLAYSTNGTDFTYVPDSNAVAISNDAASSTVETYNNFALPQACDDQETLFIKVFINGGESIDGNELADMLKGNTGINKITLSGVPKPPTVAVTVNTVLLEHSGDESGTLSVDATVRINGQDYQTQNGALTLNAESGEVYTLQASVNGTFVHTVQFTAGSGDVTVPLVAADTNGDGYINGRDWAAITAMPDAAARAKYKASFASLVGAESASYSYE